MTETIADRIQSAELRLPCADVAATQAFFVGELGFRLDAVFPADDPTIAVLSGHGLRLRLERAPEEAPLTLRLALSDVDSGPDGELSRVAPNGTRIEFVAASPVPVLPPLQPSLVVARADDGARWTEGRAGMSYRDLIPGRLGGRFIASHIRIPHGGPVADWVHYHRVRFQMIYCYRGRVRVVYEDQGEPFDLLEGDCVLQPPEIRHRVLDCTDGLEVIEIGCPAEHETLADHELTLPTPGFRPERDFAGQRFHRHQSAAAGWAPGPDQASEVRDLGLAAASSGAAEAFVLRSLVADQARVASGDLDFRFVLEGTVTLHCEGSDPAALSAGDGFTLPAGLPYRLSRASTDLELLAVRSPLERSEGQDAPGS